MKRLVYVSESLIEQIRAEDQVLKMVADARNRNILLDVTGALIFTGNHFAQILEGSYKAVDELMDSINRDPRHHKITVLDQSPMLLRRFIGWRMSYNGPSPFISRYLEHLVQNPTASEKLRATSQLIDYASV